MQFLYRVINEEMRLSEGTLEAADYDAARQAVFNNQWQLISLEEAKGFNGWLTKSFKSKVSYNSIAAFCSQLAMMIRSGSNLVRGLEILQSQIEDKRLKTVVGILYKSVSHGNSLAQAMKDTEGALPELLVNLVAVGEDSGSLDSILTSMAEYYERENFIRKKITSAAIYPIILTLVLIGLVIFFLGFILPEITDLLKDNGQKLPLITQIVVDSAHFLQANGLYLIGGFIGLGLALQRLFQIPKYRLLLHRFLLSLPLLGENMKNVITARFSRTLALFLHSAIPIVPILYSLEKIVGNEVPRVGITRAREKVIQGEPLAQAFGEETFFDALLIQMISIGEETGRLEELMVEVANNYDKRVEIGIARLVALVEPIFTVVIGGFAGLLIISIALPIFNMSSGIK